MKAMGATFVRVRCKGHSYIAGVENLTPHLQPQEAGYESTLEPSMCPRCKCTPDPLSFGGFYDGPAGRIIEGA